MSLDFEEKGLSKAKYSDNEHPLYVYLERETETGSDIILTRWDFIGFVYSHDNTVVKAYLTKKVVNFKATSKDKRQKKGHLSGKWGYSRLYPFFYFKSGFVEWYSPFNGL